MSANPQINAVKRFRKKPIVIAAIQYTEENKEALKKFVGGKICFKYEELDILEFCYIRTLEGVMTGNKGDWIIKGVKGEFYPCKPDIFEETYEEVTP